MTYHIPDEIVEAAAKALHRETLSTASWQQLQLSCRNLYINEARSALTAALDAWVKCGMAREGSARHTLDGFAPYSNPITTDWCRALIIRTEAP